MQFYLKDRYDGGFIFRNSFKYIKVLPHKIKPLRGRLLHLSSLLLFLHDTHVIILLLKLETFVENGFTVSKQYIYHNNNQSK